MSAKKTKRGFKHWVINLVIGLIVTVLMLVIAEGVMRWLDGYTLTDAELKYDTTTQQVE